MLGEMPPLPQSCGYFVMQQSATKLIIQLMRPQDLVVTHKGSVDSPLNCHHLKFVEIIDTALHECAYASYFKSPSLN